MMQESWIDKDEKSIREDIISIAKKETGLTNFKSTGVLRGFIEVIARVVIFVYQSAINPLYKNASLDGATGFFLSCWGLMLGVVRKRAIKTSGQFTATAHGDGNVPAGAWIVVEGTDLRYKVTDTVSFQANIPFNIPVTAEFSGDNYNIGSGISIHITRVVRGLDTLGVGEDWIVTPGQEEESDEAYRERIKSRWRSQILGDIAESYRYYAATVDGVRFVKVIRAPRGAGSCDVIVSSVSGMPSEALLEQVREALYNHELMGFDVLVRAPSATPIEIEIEYRGEADEADVRLVVEEYIYGIEIGGRFAIRDLYATFDPLNLTTIEILSPDRDIQALDSYIITASLTVRKVGG
jgi:uncharacterized phage protein gp47/JayE